jgi:hypothetical protein
MKLKILIIALLGIFFFVKCSSQVPEIRKIKKISEGIYSDSKRINVMKIYAWVNLMPGAKPKFHITGSIELLDDSKYELKNLHIKKINIIQNDNAIYQITPKVEEKLLKSKKEFLFSTIRGLNYTTFLEKEKPIEVELEFSDSAVDFNYIIQDVKIEEVH